VLLVYRVDRVTRGMATKASKDKWPGGSRPYGYHVDRDTQRLVPEAPHLREIFCLFTTQRLGTRAIAAELNRWGAANRTGKPWSGHTINRIIANRAYAGDIAYGDVYAENTHEPLIDRDTWRKATAIATAPRDGWPGGAGGARTHDRRIMSPRCYGSHASASALTSRYEPTWPPPDPGELQPELPRTATTAPSQTKRLDPRSGNCMGQIRGLSWHPDLWAMHTGGPSRTASHTLHQGPRSSPCNK
jgi:hypothetical protein